MKVNYTHLASFLVAIILSIWLMFLISCSANFHMRKFIKKGGVIEQTEKTILVTDTLRINGKDSIIFRTISVQCPELEAPKTRWQTRIEYKYRYKTIRDSFETIRYIVKQDRKEAVKQAKTSNRKSLSYLVKFISVIVGLLIIIVYLLRTNK